MDINEILGRIGFDWQLALFNFVNFLVVFVLLWKFLFSKALASISARQEQMAATFDNAEKLETELKEARQNADATISQARREADEIIAETRKKSAELSAELKTETEAEIEKMIEKARGQIEAEKVEALQSVRKEIAEMIIQSTEKLTGEVVTDKLDDDLIQQALQK